MSHSADMTHAVSVMPPLTCVMKAETEETPLRWQEAMHRTDAAECRQIRSRNDAECGESSLFTSRSLESRTTWKLGSTVRRGDVGKVPLDGNSLASYPAPKPLIGGVSAPSEAWCVLQGASPCRVRASHPPVASVASVAELETSSEQDRRSVHSESCRP